MDKILRKEVPAGKFKQECLALMDEVLQTGLEIIITKRGKAICRMVPLEKGGSPEVGWMKGSVSIKGDITKPTGEIWEAQN
ncbi:type II toxin-antitoxin system Phd/YefM family antitoxin [Candidatus Riflebacteria bacterium]